MGLTKRLSNIINSEYRPGLSTNNVGSCSRDPGNKSPCNKEGTLFSESIKLTINSGFGEDDKLFSPTPPKGLKLVDYLIKENYLSEFQSETEKRLARTNLGVYSAKEVDQLANNLVVNISNKFMSKEDVNNRMNELIEQVNLKIDSIEFVDSTIKALADYSIPETLFIL